MNILMIGNSFSVDVSTYVHQIAEAACKEINIYVLYIGGCPIKRHYENILSGEKAYEFYINGNRNPSMWCSIQEGLKYTKYDYVTFQQVSTDSGDEKSFYPELPLLLKEVRKFTDAKFILHMTWSYGKYYEHHKYGKDPLDQDAMDNDIFHAYDVVSKEVNIPFVIPSGKAVQQARLVYGDELNRDGFHLNERGRTLTGYVLAYYFLGKDIDVSKFRPLGHSYDDVTPAVDEKELPTLSIIAKDVLKGGLLHG